MAEETTNTDKIVEVVQELNRWAEQLSNDLQNLDGTISNGGLGANAPDFAGDASSVASKMAGTPENLRAELAKIYDAIRGRERGSNALTGKLNEWMRMNSDANKNIRSLFHGDGSKFLDSAGKDVKAGAEEFYEAVMYFKDAATKFTTGGAIGSSVKGLTSLFGSLMKGNGQAWGMVGTTALSAVGGLALGGGMMALNAVSGFFKKVFQENWEAVFGGNASNALRLSGRAGFLSMDNPSLSGADYSLYRTYMRYMGARSDDAVAKAPVDLMKGGVIGRGGRLEDALIGALGIQAASNRFNFDLNPGQAANLYRLSASNRAGLMFDQNGMFNPMGLIRALNMASNNTINPYTGATTSMEEFNSALEEATKGLQGSNNNLSDLVSNIASWGIELRDNWISASDLGQMYSAFGHMKLDNQMALLAFGGQGGDLMTKAWNIMERSVDATGKITNVQEMAQGLLGMYRAIGGNANSGEQRMIFREMLSGYLPNLADNPKALELLQKAARGDRSAKEAIETASKTEVQALMEQSVKLDAIRNPIEHLADYVFRLFGDDVQGIFEGRVNRMKYAEYLSDPATLEERRQAVEADTPSGAASQTTYSIVTALGQNTDRMVNAIKSSSQNTVGNRRK